MKRWLAMLVLVASKPPIALLTLHLRVEPHALASGEAAKPAASAVGSIVRTLILGCHKAEGLQFA